MATQTKVELIDDLTGGKADETVMFAIDGREYEIDLSLDNAGELRDNMARYLAKARKLTAVPTSRARSNGNGGNRASVDREQLRAIREWARQHGHNVSDRGRISAEIKQAFDAAHPTVNVG
jgi:nucleoid-associated protein Lsr2